MESFELQNISNLFKLQSTLRTILPNDTPFFYHFTSLTKTIKPPNGIHYFSSLLLFQCECNSRLNTTSSNILYKQNTLVC